MLFRSWRFCSHGLSLVGRHDAGPALGRRHARTPEGQAVKIALLPFAAIMCLFMPNLWPAWVFGWLFIAVFL